jgi:hypothetical protein
MKNDLMTDEDDDLEREELEDDDAEFSEILENAIDNFSAFKDWFSAKSTKLQ